MLVQAPVPDEAVAAPFLALAVVVEQWQLRMTQVRQRDIQPRDFVLAILGRLVAEVMGAQAGLNQVEQALRAFCLGSGVAK